MRDNSVSNTLNEPIGTAPHLKTSDAIAMLKLCRSDMSHLNVLKTSASLYFKHKNVLCNGEQESGSIICVGMG